MVDCLPLLGNNADDMHLRCSDSKKIRCNISTAIKGRISAGKDRTPGKGDGNNTGSEPRGSLHKGLSPPHSPEAAKVNADEDLKTCPTMNSITEMSSQAGIFDRTQWERTRFAKEAAGIIDSREAVRKAQEGAKESKLPGESRQSTAVRGEYLNEKPKFTITLLVIELMWCVAGSLVWGAAADNPVLPQLLALFNMLIIFLLILACLSTEYFRFQVRREDTRSDTRFYVPYIWRYVLCEAHLARAILLCANVTIMAFDNDYDIGSIIVLAATPVHLILTSLHIFTAIKPRRQ
ncbi:unnamed protein product [Cylicocyclus nassatus]|uniref:Uncharacterized protein n=1 Tax=Cylicocyclus nassatus TaxID=53992 RepID=A0AA36DMA6_CYLNA|nr:unnamed protein product [Cylicocyclus nassatus]